MDLFGPRKFGAMRTIFALMLREMATTYGGSPGGYAWAILEPVAGIFLLTIVFSLALESPPLGTNFPYFYASGYLTFMLYLNVSNKVAATIRFSKPLLFYPSVRMSDAILARVGLNVLTETLILLIVMSVVVILWQVPVDLNFTAIGNGIMMAVVLAAGIGTLNCFLTTQFPVWDRLWAVLTRPLFVISTLFFLFEAVPHPYDGLLWFNPLVHVIGQIRTGFFPGYSADFVSPAYVYVMGGVSFVIGLWTLNRTYRTHLGT